MASILTIEDNIETQLILKRALEDKHNVIVAYDLESAKHIIKDKNIDLIMLDLMLPDGQGLSLFNELCVEGVSKIPVIILSSLSDMKTKVNGLELGADDYINKPFEQRELLARIDSVLRRGPTRQSDSVIVVADVSIDLNKQMATQKDQKGTTDLELTPIELKILTVLSKQMNQDLSRDYLKDAVWGKTFISRRNVDTHICKLRKKLEATRLDITNKRGKGYHIVIKETKSEVPAIKTLELPAFGQNKHLTVNL